MALTKFGFIVTGNGLDPDKHRVEMTSSVFAMIAVGVPNPQRGLIEAQRLMNEGIQLLELCGGFGPVWTGKIIEALQNKIPVGSVSYGPESIDAMHALFSK